VYDPISHLLHAAARSDVTDVWIGGARIVDDRRVTTIDRGALLTRARAWQQRLT